MDYIKSTYWRVEALRSLSNSFLGVIYVRKNKGFQKKYFFFIHCTFFTSTRFLFRRLTR